MCPRSSCIRTSLLTRPPSPPSATSSSESSTSARCLVGIVQDPAPPFRIFHPLARDDRLRSWEIPAEQASLTPQAPDPPRGTYCTCSLQCTQSTLANATSASCVLRWRHLSVRYGNVLCQSQRHCMAHVAPSPPSEHPYASCVMDLTAKSVFGNAPSIEQRRWRSIPAPLSHLFLPEVVVQPTRRHRRATRLQGPLPSWRVPLGSPSWFAFLTLDS